MFYMMLIIIPVAAATSHEIPYRVCQEGNNNLRKNLQPILIWQEDQKNYVSLSESCRKMIKPLIWNNDTLRVLVVRIEPYLRLDRDTKNIGGFLGEIWKIISAIFNFEYILTPISYIKGIDLMEKGKGDIFLAPVIAEYNIENVEFSQPYFTNWYNLYVTSPSLEVSSTFYLKAFSIELWLFTVASFFTLTIIIWIMGRILKRLNPGEPTVSIPTCFLGVMSGFTNQGYDLKFQSYSIRTLICFTLFLGFVLNSAMLAVFYYKMTNYVGLRLPVNSLEEISTKRSFSVCVRNNSHGYAYFLDKNRKILPKWQTILNNKHCLDLDDQNNLRNLLCKEGIVTLENNFRVSGFLKNTRELPCKPITLNQKLLIRGNSFALAKHLKSTNEIRTIFLKMKSSGVLKYLEGKIRHKDKNKDNSTWHPVTMDHIRAGLIWYCGMIILSLIILRIEIFYNK